MLGTRVTLTLAASLVLAPLVGCAAITGSRDGVIDEVERGRNGTKVEVIDGDGHDEFYLLSDSPCQRGQRLRECADVDDFLKPVPGAVPGVNPTTPR